MMTWARKLLDAPFPHLLLKKKSGQMDYSDQLPHYSDSVLISELCMYVGLDNKYWALFIILRQYKRASFYNFGLGPS